MKKILMIVDPQVDFVSGSLPVTDAAAHLDKLSDYVHAHSGDYVLCIVTTDWHPYNHCSFKAQGGSWPVHCVQNSIGAAIYQPLLDALCESGMPYKVLRKGNFADHEEYGIFKNQLSSQYIQNKVKLLGIDRIDICGLAGDYCVHDTLLGGYELFGKKVNVLKQFSPSFDGGKRLEETLAHLGL